MIHNTIERKQRGPSRTEGSRCFRCGVCKEKIGGNGKGSGRLFQGRGGLCRAAGSVALQPSRQHKGHGAQCGAQDKYHCHRLSKKYMLPKDRARMAPRAAMTALPPYRKNSREVTPTAAAEARERMV